MLVKLGNQIFSVGFKHTLPDPGIKMSAVKTSVTSMSYLMMVPKNHVQVQSLPATTKTHSLRKLVGKTL